MVYKGKITKTASLSKCLWTFVLPVDGTSLIIKNKVTPALCLRLLISVLSRLNSDISVDEVLALITCS